jgi:hypothetical protein
VFRNYKTKKQILRRSTPQNDIAPQPHAGMKEGELRVLRASFVVKICSHLVAALPR